MRKVCICGAGTIGLGVIQHLIALELQNDMAVHVVGYPHGEESAARLHLESIREVTEPSDWSDRDFILRMREDYEQIAPQLIFPIELPSIKEVPLQHFEPPQFKGYMKRTHRRRM